MQMFKMEYVAYDEQMGIIASGVVKTYKNAKRFASSGLFNYLHRKYVDIYIIKSWFTE